MNVRFARVIVLASVVVGGCAGGSEPRLLAVGNTYVFERQTPCKLLSAKPEGVLEDLDWTEVLVLETLSEGAAEVACGSERFELEIAQPARLDIDMTDGARPTGLAVGDRFAVQARLFDYGGRELEVGKLTIFEWIASDLLEAANDRSSGEFGYCDTCYGMYSFRALRPGKGLIEAHLGELRGQLQVRAIP